MRVSEPGYRRLFEAAQDGVLIVDFINQKITDANPFMTELLGYTHEEFLGRELWEIGLLKDQQGNHAVFRQLQQYGKARHENLPLETKTGEQRRVELVAARYETEGRPVIQCIIRDVTARHDAEQSLRESVEFNRSLMDGSGDCLKVLDVDGRVLMMNAPGMCQMEIDDFELLRGQEWASLWPPECREALRAAVERARTGKLGSFEALCPTVKGTLKWWEVSVSPVRSAPGGPVVRLLSVSRDITARRQAEAARARLAAIVEFSEDAIVSKDLNGVITSWNSGAHRLFGYTAQEAIGQPVTMLIPVDHLDEGPAILARIARGEPIEHYETARRRKDGALIDISLTVSPIRNEQGQIIGASKVARDISERKRAEEELRHTLDELTRFNRIMVGRENRMIELKKEVNALRGRLGEPPGYTLDFAADRARNDPPASPPENEG